MFLVRLTKKIYFCCSFDGHTYECLEKRYWRQYHINIINIKRFKL